MPEPPLLAEIANHHREVEESLRLFFSDVNPAFAARFAFLARKEVNALLRERIAEAEQQSSLATLAGVEASLRIDYRTRSRRKGADPISVAFRKIHKVRGDRARLDQDIITTWYDCLPPSNRVILSRLRGMFKSRHWLAHGRYWNFAPN